MSKKRAFEERGWNDSLDLPRYLRRGLSGMYVFHKFPGEGKATPTSIEDCTPGTIRGWLLKEDSIEMARNTLNHLSECIDAVLKMLKDDEKKMVLDAIENRGDKPEIDNDSDLFELVDAVVWYCNMMTLTADIFGICSPDTEAEIAYNERTERRKSQKS